DGRPKAKFSFIIHTEAGRAAHKWQVQVVTALKDQLQAATQNNKAQLDTLVKASYENLSRSIKIKNHYLPSFDEVSKSVYEALTPGLGQLMITKVNSEEEVMNLLDEQGQ